MICLKETEVCNFADDKPRHVCDENVEQVLIRLEHDSAIAICWVSGNKNEYMWAKLGNDKMWESNTVKLLGITIDYLLKFNEHVLYIYQKASRKLSALSRMSSFLSFLIRKEFFLRFFEYQFKYCPLVWIFSWQRSKSRIKSYS